MWILFATLAHGADCSLDVIPPAPHRQGPAQTFDVLGATPGSTVLFFQDGTDPACPPQIAPHCLDMEGSSLVGFTTADGAGVASFSVSVPAGLDPTEHAWQAVSQDCGVSDMAQTTASSPIACAYDPLDWGVECTDGPMGCFLTGWFDTMHPGGMSAFGTTLTLDQARTGLTAADTHTRAALALALSVDADDMGLLGSRSSIGDAFVPNGPYVGFQVREVAVLALASAPVSADLGSTAVQVLQTFGACGDGQLVMPGWPTYPPDSGPGDSGDSGVVDTGGPTDSGTVDTGTPGDTSADSAVDTGTPGDTSVDSGTVDTGTPADSGALDTGAAADTSADSAVDTGAVDTGFADSAVDTSADSGAPADSGTTLDTGSADSASDSGDSGAVDTGIGGGDTGDSGG